MSTIYPSTSIREARAVDWRRTVLLFVAAFVLAGTLPPVGTAAQSGSARKPLPLEGTRDLSFITDEGSWISLDVSPDGRTIIFELLGDLYMLPIEGGDAKRITDGMAFDSQPRFSPDGSRIVFLSDRSGAENVWTAKPDGTDARALTTGRMAVYRSPEWTPDGKYVVVSKTADPAGMHLWLYHVDGGSGVQLTGKTEEQRNFAPVGAAFGKDGRYIYFTQRTGAPTSVYNQMEFVRQLAVYDRNTGEIYRQSDELGSAMRPVLSPDGRWLVYATRWDAKTGLRVRDMKSGDDAWLVYPVQRDDQESSATRDFMPGSSFTPDSKSLVTSFDGRLWRVMVPDGKLTQIPFTAKVDQKIGPKLQFTYAVEEGAVRAQQIRYPRLSPDGRQLAFTAFDRLYVMDYPKGTPRRVSKADHGEHHPVWSPDGNHVAYVTWSDRNGGGGDLYRVRADLSASPEKLSEIPSFYSDPVYSPDGQRIVVVRGPRAERQEDFSPAGRGGQALELVWLPASGGPTTLVSPFRGPGRPHFSKDPARIYVWEGSRGLTSFRFDGTDRKSHVKVTGWKAPTAREAPPASEVLIGPEGDQAIVEAQRHVYLVTVPAVGGEPPSISVSSRGNAPVPVRKLTVSGGEFLDWAENGKAVTFALGRTMFRYDLATAKAAEEKQRAADEKKGTADKGRAEDEPSGEKDAEEKDEEARKKPAYEADEVEVIVELSRPKPRGTVALRGARIITMQGIEVIDNGDIVITDNRIAGLGRRGGVDIPAGAKVIDVKGKTIMPGLVDVHAHIWPAWDIHKEQIWEYLANLAYGVTTTRDPQTATTDVLTYRDMVEAGFMVGPRVYHTGPGVFSSDNVQSLEEARDVLRRYSKYWDTKTIKQYMAGVRQQRQWIVMAAREQQLMPTLEGGLI